MQGRIANDPAPADLVPLQFELRFDQRNDHTVWS